MLSLTISQNFTNFEDIPLIYYLHNLKLHYWQQHLPTMGTMIIERRRKDVLEKTPKKWPNFFHEHLLKDENLLDEHITLKRSDNVKNPLVHK